MCDAVWFEKVMLKVIVQRKNLSYLKGIGSMFAETQISI